MANLKDTLVLGKLTATDSIIADKFKGTLPEELKEVAIHESSFRLLNILRATETKDINCFFNQDYNIFFIKSQLKQDDFWIKSRLLISIIKGK